MRWRQEHYLKAIMLAYNSRSRINYIGVKGARALSQGNLTSLKSLKLQNNSIGVDGTIALR